MVRGPVQIQGRGGAASGEVGNRAQYMRPALDNQNSRMLAKAFSQINSSLGRIASNESRLAERQRNDEYKDSLAYQQQQKELASQLGALSAVTGDEYIDQFWNNPANLMAYNESNIIGQLDEDLVGMMSTIQQDDNYGNPQGRAALQDQLSTFVQERIESTPAELRPEVLARFAPLAAKVLAESDALAVQRADAEIISNFEKGVRRSAYEAGDYLEYGASLLEHRQQMVGIKGRERGNAMFLDVFSTELKEVVWQSDLEHAGRVLDYATQLMSNEDFMDQFGSGQGGAQESMKTAFKDAQRDYSAAVKAAATEQERQQNESNKAFLEGQYASVSDPGNTAEIGSYLPAFREQFGREEGTEKWKEFKDIQQTYISAITFADDDPFSKGQSAQSLVVFKAELAEEIVKPDFDRSGFMAGRLSSLTEADGIKLMSFVPEVPEAIEHPFVKSLLKDSAAMADLAGQIMGDTSMGVTGTTTLSRSEIKRQYEAKIRDLIEQDSAGWKKALAEGTVDKFLNNIMDQSSGYILDGQFGSVDDVTIRQELNKKIQDPSDLLMLSNNVIFRKYFADESMIQMLVEYETGLIPVTDTDEDLELAYNFGPVGLIDVNPYEQQPGESVADALERNLGVDNPAAAMARFEEAQGLTREALQDDDGDGIINSREPIFELDAPSETGLNRETLGIDNLKSPTQSSGKKVPASIRTFNFGGIGRITNGKGPAKFKKAFGEKSSINLKASSGGRIDTPSFDTIEQGVQYLGFWMEHRKVKPTVNDLINKYATGNPSDYKKYVVEQTGFKPAAALTDEQLAEAAIAMFQWEAGARDEEAQEMLKDIMSKTDVATNIQLGKKLYTDN